MLKRRSFILSVTAVSFMANILGRSSSLHSQRLGATEDAEDDNFDFDGYYVSVCRESSETLTLSEIINNRLKEQETVYLDDSAAIEGFLKRAGLVRIRFIDWNGTTPSSSDIACHEISINWENENPLDGLLDSFRTCSNLLSCPA
jgi:hypothetical protein